MDLPSHPLARVRLAFSETLKTAGVERVYAIGDLDPLSQDFLSQFTQTGGKFEKLDCTCCVSTFPGTSGSCAWILPPVTNYYHAYRLLHGIRAMCAMHATPFLVLCPKLESAIIRRDYYIGSSQVPPAWRHCSESCVMSGKTSERAAFKGGLRNGVLTAIEDFTEELWDEGTALVHIFLPTLGGFCALFDVDADWSAKLAYDLAAFHENAAVAPMSEQELRDYLAMIERSGRRPGEAAQ
ncbi:hypothetical protein [Qipengyuania sp. 483]